MTTPTPSPTNAAVPPALVITNDGRTSMLRSTALMAAELLRDHHI